MKPKKTATTFTNAHAPGNLVTSTPNLYFLNLPRPTSPFLSPSPPLSRVFHQLFSPLHSHSSCGSEVEWSRRHRGRLNESLLQNLFLDAFDNRTRCFRRMLHVIGEWGCNKRGGGRTVGGGKGVQDNDLRKGEDRGSRWEGEELAIKYLRTPWRECTVNSSIKLPVSHGARANLTASLVPRDQVVIARKSSAGMGSRNFFLFCFMLFVMEPKTPYLRYRVESCRCLKRTNSKMANFSASTSSYKENSSRKFWDHLQSW